VFDKVNLHALFIKLMQKNIPFQLLRLLEDIICVCFSCVKWGEIRSTFFSVMYCVRQGSVLAPFLFAIYLDDLSEICTPNCGRFITLYADDILLMTYSVVTTTTTTV